MNDKTLTQSASFFQEYTSDDAITKYTSRTAGFGINYLLDHEYKAVYLDALHRLPPHVLASGIRVLEFGCGGGMNLIRLLAVLRGAGVRLEKAIGADFSPVLIDAARREAKDVLKEGDLQKIEFHVAKNEQLIDDLASALESTPGELKNSFHFIIGVNTIRYCHAGKKEMDNARDIYDLLAPGGVSVVIDMNNRFPLFRSDLKNRFRREKEEECYVPSLEEYADPFFKTGFEVLRTEHFCWIPHSSGRMMCLLMRALSPVLNGLFKSRAMRSLVVARKPNQTR
jgi:SAM-dependent methyltransferase